MYATFWALVPPIVAIALALITKEVYSSLFIGILVGGLFYSGFNFEGTLVHIFNEGLIAQLSDAYNVGILIFLVFLGIMVCLMNKAGGSAAFGKRYAPGHGPRECVPRKAGLPDRRDGCTGLHHRPHFFLGGGSFRLRTGGNQRTDAVHQRDSL